MNKKLIIIITISVFVLSIFFYLVGTNYVAYIETNSFQNTQNKGNGIISFMDVNLGVAENVNIGVKRDCCWYGEISGDDNIENLHLFNTIKIPVRVNGKYWGWYHISILSTLIFLFANIIIIELMLKETRSTHKRDNENLNNKLYK